MQKTRRVYGVGELDEVYLSEVRDVERPVLYLSDCQGEPDRRIFPQLSRQRALDRRERMDRMKRKLADEKKAREQQSKEAYAPAREGLENAVYDMRAKGIGAVKPSYVPGSFSAA